MDINWEEYVRQVNNARNLTGQNALDALEGILKDLQEGNIIFDYSKELGTRNNYADPYQYGLYAPFLITLKNGSMWALYSTTSLRDRIKMQHWDSLLVKKFYDNDIEKCYLIYPDSVSNEEKGKFITANEKIQNIIIHHNNLDELDGILSQSELIRMLVQASLSDMDNGVMQDSRGKTFENSIASVLKDEHNIARWNGDRLESGNQYPTFVSFLDKFGCGGRQIRRIITKTGRELGRLPSGGFPKTDICVEISFEDGLTTIFTISCKISSKKWVSAHEYSAQAFIEALSITDEELISKLHLFQCVGGEESMSRDDRLILKKKLTPYVRKLTEWVITGKYGAIASSVQIADYIAIGIDYGGKTNILLVYSAEEYIDLVLSTVDGQFGTPFIWTYPSKKKGKKIQLKMKTIAKEYY